MPFGIIGLPDHIELHAAGQHIINEENRFIILSAQGHMQHQYHGWIHGFNRRITGIDQLRQLVKIANIPFRPYDTMIDLIAHLYHIRCGALCFERFHHLLRKIIYFFLECRKIQSLPGSGLILFPGIGPVITVMKIEQQLHPRRFYPFGHGQRMRQITKSLTR